MRVRWIFITCRTYSITLRIYIAYSSSYSGVAASVGSWGTEVTLLGRTGSNPVTTVKGGKPWLRAAVWRMAIRAAGRWSDQ